MSSEDEKAAKASVEEFAKLIGMDLSGMDLSNVTVESPSEEVVEDGVTFKDILDTIDSRDSDAGLLMLDWLLQTGRLQRLGVLDGGAGYLFGYKEPKGSSKQGYAPGGTKGDRIVDAAVEQTRASGIEPTKRGLCKHCFSAVYKHVSGAIMLDDDAFTKGDGDLCDGSPDGRHHMTS